MKIVILGVSGLIGHKLLVELSDKFDTYGTLRQNKTNYNNLSIFSSEKVIENIDAHDFNNLIEKLNEIDPSVVINCIGITKRKKEINIPFEAITINALFPHKLAKWAKEKGKRIIHFSTDCVFDGNEGDYTEESNTTAEDAYGKTKALGEINYDHTLTIRSSFIGRELFTKTELLEWFLQENSKEVKGFTKAMYTGVSTTFLARTVADIIENHPNLSGLRQLSTKTSINKFDLLNIAKEAFNKNVIINPDDSFELDASLNGNKLRNEINYVIPSWKEMMEELALDSDIYNKIK